jgi:hypothetical protein
MKRSRAVRAWAREELGKADLGDLRRTQRLVSMAEQAAVSPSGRITEVFRDAAEREGAYRLLENEEVECSQVIAGAASACAARAIGPYVVVPIDQSSLSLPSADGDEAFGPVGNGATSARGLEAMSAIAVDRDGVLLGVAGQKFFKRQKAPKKGKQKRPFEEKETRHWLEVMNSSLEVFTRAGIRPWYQLDRGGDFKEALQWAADNEAASVTIRAHHDRRAEGETEGPLWDVVMKSIPLGEYDLQVSARPSKRKARVARMQVRAVPVYLPLQDSWSKTTGPVITFAVHTVEISKVPRNETPIEWMLLVNRSVDTLPAACEVISNYAQRWKIEEVHRVWKTTCTVERSNLRSSETFAVWAAILFCIAVRVERLKRLSRAHSNLPANVELSEWEIRTLLLLKDRPGYDARRTPTIGEVVRWLAELGGYTGKSSGGPPGAQTIGRGLKSIDLATQAVRALTGAEK